MDENQILQLVASLAVGSEHPLAEAIVASANEQGVEGIIQNKHLFFGNQKLMTGQAINIDRNSLHVSRQMANEAKTSIFLAVDGHLATVIAVADPIKEETFSAIKRLQHNGIKIVMFTGDT